MRGYDRARLLHWDYREDSRVLLGGSSVEMQVYCWRYFSVAACMVESPREVCESVVGHCHSIYKQQ